MPTAAKTATQARLTKESAERDTKMAKQKSDRLAAEGKNKDALEQSAKRVTALYKSMREFEAHAEKKAGFELKKAAEKRAALEKALGEARDLCKAAGKSFNEFQEKFAPDYKRTQLYQILAIADGRTTVEDVRKNEREKKRKRRAGKVSGTNPVPDKAPEPKTEAPATVSATGSAERSIEQVKADGAALADKSIEETPDQPDHGTAPATAKSSRINADDTALIGFTAHVLDLVRRIGKHPAKRFACTAVGADELLKLGTFFAELGQLKSGESKPAVH
jgi:hypothetical protein